MKITDGADIAQCVFWGSSNLHMRENYTDVFSKDEWFPFGWDAGGNPLLIHRDGEVVLGVGKSTTPQFERIGASFSDFLNNVILGQNYPKIYSIPDDEIAEFIEEEKEDDPWLLYLIEKDWLLE